MSKNLSDFNSITRPKRVAKTTLFSDLNLKLVKHPGTDDVSPLRDLDAITNSVKHLLLTDYGDRPFHPEVGSNVSRLLFEPADAFTAVTLKDEIKQCLERFEPRVRNVSVSVIDNMDINAYQIQVGFNVRQTDEPQEIAFYLERLR
jgi:phage baseplate assembly protein W